MHILVAFSIVSRLLLRLRSSCCFPRRIWTIGTLSFFLTYYSIIFISPDFWIIQWAYKNKMKNYVLDLGHSCAILSGSAWRSTMLLEVLHGRGDLKVVDRKSIYWKGSFYFEASTTEKTWALVVCWLLPAFPCFCSSFSFMLHLLFSVFWAGGSVRIRREKQLLEMCLQISSNSFIFKRFLRYFILINQKEKKKVVGGEERAVFVLFRS